MKKGLSQLTMEQYIAVVCGEMGALGIADPIEAAEERKRLICEFASLSDPAGTTAYASRVKGEIDAKATLLLFRICSNLIAMKEVGEVRRILADYGIRSSGMSDKQVAAEVRMRMHRAKAAVGRNANAEAADEAAKPKTAEDIRRLFDRQAASLMTYFQFQIDFKAIKATTFAYMIDQADREIKAKKAAMARLR